MSVEKEVKDLIVKYKLLEAELKRRQMHDHVMYYGLPDLLFPKNFYPGSIDKSTGNVVRQPLEKEETDEQYKTRQNEAVSAMITEFLWFEKDGRKINPVIIPPMVELIADLLYRRVNRVILWANRGGGKSLLAAIVIWLVNVYRGQSFLNVAGAGDQARRVYEYTKKFWYCVPGLSNGLLERKPLQKLTSRKNGTRIVCIDSSASAIGEHVPGFVADEAVTGSDKSDNNISRAMQGSLSEPNYLVFMLSTFHIPTGLFQRIWDSTENNGFTRYKWNIYDCMSRCTAGLETATPEDPYALEYCHTKCPLTRNVDNVDKYGKIVGKKVVGCCGKARNSTGWIDRGTVIESYEVNKGTGIFTVEHECVRPRHQGLIYNPDLISECLVEDITLDLDTIKTVGIDWGLTQCAVCLVIPWIDNITGVRGCGVVAVRYMSNQLVAEVADQIRAWQEVFGDNILVRSDASHPYANKELRQYGYRVRAVKGDKKRVGETNLMRWMGSGLLKIYGKGMGIPMFMQQMNNLRRDTKTGKQKKRNVNNETGDHGPDAVKFAMMNYDFVTWRKNLIEDGIIGEGDIIVNKKGELKIKKS